MLYYYFNHHKLGKEMVTLHADDCSCQNKDDTMMQYLMRKVMTGLHHPITISYLVVGHTKLDPNSCSDQIGEERVQVDSG